MKKQLLLYGLLFVSTISFSQWTVLNSGSTGHLNSVYFTDANTGYVAGNSGILLKTTDGGTTWTVLPSGTFNSLFSIFFINDSTGYAVGAAGIILKTNDAGNTWHSMLSGTSLILTSVHFPTADTGYVVSGYTSSATILKTVDGGDTWTTIWGPIFTEYLSSVTFTDATNGFAGGGEVHTGIILKTTNGGATWSSAYISGVQYLNSICFPDASKGHAAGLRHSSGALLAKSIDGGTTWTCMPFGFSQPELFSVYFPDTTTGYTVGYGGTILKTIDGGLTWFSEASGTGKSLKSVFFPNALTGYAVGELGTIIKTTNGGAPFLFPSNRDVPFTSGTTTFSKTSNESWTAVSNASWSSLSPYGTGNDPIVVNYSANNTLSSRVAELKVWTANSDSMAVTVTQEGHYLRVTPANQDVLAINGLGTFCVISNSEWTVVSNDPWCITEQLTGSVVFFTCTENTSSSTRIAHIDFNFKDLTLPSQTVTVTVTQAGSTYGIESVADKDFIIYPNPTTGSFKLVTGEVNFQPGIMTICDLNNQVILRKPFSGEKECWIDLSTANQGCYFLILESNDRVIVRKLVILR